MEEQKEDINNEIPIYRGSRGLDFKNMIVSFLNKGNLKDKYIQLLTNTNSMETYDKVFTANSADSVNNSEIFELIGDTSVNKFIVWYMYRRFPQLNCVQGVKVLARLKINYGSKQSFSSISESLGFWPYITASEEERSKRKKPLLEDTLEAVIGSVEYLIDSKVRLGAGYAIIYDILSKIFDEKEISLRYEDLYDSKTRIKELFDLYGERLGILEYVDEKTDSLTTTVLYRVEGGGGKNKLQGGRRMQIGLGTAALKADSQQKAATNALALLKSQGFVKETPQEYLFFCKN